MSEIGFTPPEMNQGQEVLSPKSSVEWFRDSEHTYSVIIGEPGVGRATGTLNDYGDTAPRSIYVDMFAADTPGNHSGTRLLELLRDEGRKYGATSMSGHFISPASLGAFLNVVDGEVSFRPRYSHEPISITAEEAMKSPQSYIASASILEKKAVDQV